VRIVFFGTPDFAASILKHLILTTQHEIVAVVSKPDAQKGRGLAMCPTPVKVVTEQCLPSALLLQPQRASIPQIVDQLKALSPDVFFVVAYGEILKEPILEIPRLGCYNVHASLLPSYRGAAPIQRALMDGCEKTGISIFHLTRGMDSGDVIWQKSCPVGPNTNVEELTASLLDLAKEGSVESLHLLETGTAVFMPQRHEEATLAPRITPEDLVLDQSKDITAIHDKVRALSPSPGAFFWITYHERRLRLKILRTHIDPMPGGPYRKWCVSDDGVLSLSTPEGVLLFDEVQLEGRSAMSSQAFLRGNPLDQIFLEKYL
jgi:methionyl-tRNA formyltransferase